MSLDRFINIDNIKTQSPIFGDTFDIGGLSTIPFEIKNIDLKLRFDGSSPIDLKYEYHIFDTNNRLIKSEYNNFFSSDKLYVSPEKDVWNSQGSGEYTIVYNTLYNFAGNPNEPDLIIDEISSDRTELKILVNSNYNLGLIKDIQDSKYESTDYVFTKNKPNFVLNFGENNIYDIAKIYFQGTSYSEASFNQLGLTTQHIGVPTIWLPKNYPITPRGRLFEEYYKNDVRFENGVNKYYKQTGRIAFFKENIVTNSDAIIEGSFEIERYTETDYTIGYNLHSSFINAPFFFYNENANHGAGKPSNSNDGVYNSVGNNDGIVKAEPISRALDAKFIFKNKNFIINKNVNFVPNSFNTLYIKLINPLGDIPLGRNVSIDGRLQKSYIDVLILNNQIIDNTDDEYFLQPNFNIELDKYGKSDGTDFKAWNDLLDQNLPTSQQIVNSYFSGSFGNIELNIDYSDFKNFVHYSSATERVDNFFSKLKIIEGYNNRITTLGSVSGFHASTNISQATERRDALIGGFDGFEKWMYNKESGSLYTHYSTTDNPIVPYPKTSTYPIAFYSTTSAQAESWYAGVYKSASLYDSQNQSALINLIPLSLREDPLNEDYVLFVNMIGQHFDILWTYIKALTDINKREEHPEDGMSDDLLYDVAKSMGWYLSSGWGDANLWEYLLGTDSSGNQSQTIGGLETKSKKKLRSEVWRRVLNNLPYIYKSKGTPRSIKALLSCYGIPSAFLKVREYGGPTIVESPNKYETERFIYKVETSKSKPIINPFGSINGSRPNTIEVIGKMPLADFTIGTLDGVDFVWNYSGSISGSGRARILMGGASSSYMNYTVPKDGVFGIINDGTSRAVFKDDFGNIHASLSSSGAIGENASNFIVGGDANSGNYSSTASIQEIRYYSSSLSEEIFQEHALNTEAYFSDDNTTDVDNSQTSYKNLVYRIFPDSGFKTSPTAISSSHPNQFFKTTSGGTPLKASLPNHTSADLVGEVDTQFVKVPSAGALNDNNNKVRIESSGLSGSLDVEKAVEVSQYDYAPLDSNLVGLYFSSTDVINDDIYNSEGYFEIDDWVGDPDDRFNDDYPLLKWRAGEYFKKYVNLTPASGSAQKRGTAIGLLLDMLSLYDHSIFQQVKQLIPARSEYVGGVLLEPHILERNKYKRGDKWSHTRMDYPLLLEDNPAVLQSTKNDYLGVIESKVLGVDSEKSDYSLPLDVKDFHEGAIYSYTYPILNSNGTHINVQNAYWERAVTSSIMNQRLSPHGKQRQFFYSNMANALSGIYSSSLLIPYPSVQTDELPLGLANSRFNGCNSGVTSIDGLPSVEIFRADPFVLGVAPQNVSTQDVIVSTPRQNRPVGSGGTGDRSGRASSGRLFV